MSKEKAQIGLPENAYRELKEGEKYNPIVSPQSKMKEITPYSVIVGIIMCVIFSGATAFLGLKTGNVFEAAIPISLMAVGLSFLFKKTTILENVIIQSIGSCSGSVVAGAIFTLPAIYILQAKYPDIQINFLHIFMASLLGGILGIVFLILFRKYFVSDMHGKFPFPEGTATTEILVSGQQGGDQAKILCISMGIGAIYDFCIYTLKLWSESFQSTFTNVGQFIGDKFKLVFGINTTAALFGMGYIIGFKYAAIMCAGSFLAWFVLVPVLGQYGYIPNPAGEGLIPMSTMSAGEIFKGYVRLIGIGGIACAGIIGIIKSAGIIVQSFTKGFKDMFADKKDSNASVPRTEKDMNMGTVISIVVLTAVATFGFFHSGVLQGRPNVFMLTCVALAVVLIISFLFTTVAARAIATVGSNPVSGMTLMTLIVTSLILVQCGVNGISGITATLIIGGVVCTALSMSGSFITDLKIGYWIGATPKNQQLFKFLGTLVAALSVAFVMMILNNTYGFVATPEHKDILVAPQANAMSAVIEPIMVSGAQTPWILYITGIILALILELVNIPALAFMLGVYIPLELNLPILAGGILALIIENSHKDKKVGADRKQKGTLIASGFVAGGAIIGVCDALLKNWKIDLALKFNGGTMSEMPQGHWLSIIMYILLAFAVYRLALKFSSSKECTCCEGKEECSCGGECKCKHKDEDEDEEEEDEEDEEDEEEEDEEEEDEEDEDGEDEEEEDEDEDEEEEDEEEEDEEEEDEEEDEEEEDEEEEEEKEEEEDEEEDEEDEEEEDEEEEDEEEEDEEENKEGRQRTPQEEVKAEEKEKERQRVSQAEEEAKKRAEEAKMKAEEAKKRAEEAKMKAEEAKKKVEEAKKKAEEKQAGTKYSDIKKQMEEERQKTDEVVRIVQEKINKKAEENKNKPFEIKKEEIKIEEDKKEDGETPKKDRRIIRRKRRR